MRQTRLRTSTTKAVAKNWEREMKMNNKHTLVSGAANPASAHRQRQRIASISLLLSLSAGILVFGPSWRAAYSSTANPAAPAAYTTTAAFQATGGEAVKLGQPLGTFPTG